MNSKFLFVAFLSVMMLIVGCGEAPLAPVPGSELSQQELAKRLPNGRKKMRAVRMAKRFLQSESARRLRPKWAVSAEISDAYPAYLEGVSDVSYYYCKVSTPENLDAGWVLVNVNRTDLSIPTFSDRGKTPNEVYADELSCAPNDLAVYRLSAANSFAERKSYLGLGDGKIAAVRGFGRSDIHRPTKNRGYYLSKRNQYRNLVKSSGHVYPGFNRRTLDSVYTISERGLSKKAGCKWRHHQDWLNGTVRPGWRTVQWEQIPWPHPGPGHGNLSGCGAVGLGIMYAYHSMFNGRTNLFAGTDLWSLCPFPLCATSQMEWFNGCACHSGRLANDLFEIAHDINSIFGNGITDPGTGSNGVGVDAGGHLFGQRWGYANSRCHFYNGDDFGHVKRALANIRAERPVMIGMGFLQVNHWAVAEEVMWREKNCGAATLWQWWDYEAWWYLNLGATNGMWYVWLCSHAKHGSNAQNGHMHGIVELFVE